MINEVKSLILSMNQDEILNITQRKQKICAELVRREKEVEELKRQSNKPTIQFSFFQRVFTKRKEYRNLKLLPEKIRVLEGIIETERAKVESELKDFGIDKRLDELRVREQRIKEANTLHDLGIHPVKAVELLERTGIQPILTTDDKVESKIESDFSDLSSLVFVHKTRYLPENSEIKTTNNAGAQHKYTVNIDGVNYDFLCQSERRTVHGTSNGEVTGHLLGEWKDCKYAIIIPFLDIQPSQVSVAIPADITVRDNVQITPNSWILCPKSEVEITQSKNPNVHVLGYDGENAQGYADSFITQLGYKKEKIGQVGWEPMYYEKDDNPQFYRLMEQNHVKIQKHFDSEDRHEEIQMEDISVIIEICKIIRHNGLINNDADIERILNQIEHNITTVDKDGEILRASIDISSIRASRIRILVARLENNGFKIDNKYKRFLADISNETKKETVREILGKKESRSKYNDSDIGKFYKEYDHAEESAKNGILERCIFKAVCQSILKEKEEEKEEEKER